SLAKKERCFMSESKLENLRRLFRESQLLSSDPSPAQSLGTPKPSGSSPPARPTPRPCPMKVIRLSDYERASERCGVCNRYYARRRFWSSVCVTCIRARHLYNAPYFPRNKTQAAEWVERGRHLPDRG